MQYPFLVQSKLCLEGAKWVRYQPIICHISQKNFIGFIYSRKNTLKVISDILTSF